MLYVYSIFDVKVINCVMNSSASPPLAGCDTSNESRSMMSSTYILYVHFITCWVGPYLLLYWDVFTRHFDLPSRIDTTEPANLMMKMVLIFYHSEDIWESLASMTLRLSMCTKSTEVEKLHYAFKHPHLVEVGKMAGMDTPLSSVPATPTSPSLPNHQVGVLCLLIVPRYFYKLLHLSSV